MKCKFCGCTELRACRIPVLLEDDDRVVPIFTPSLVDDPTIQYIPCSWLIPNVCSAPACVEKAYIAVNPFAIMGENRIVA